MRVGDYRVVYRIDDERRAIDIAHVRTAKKCIAS
ncbi:MAG: type II toxin-antitoxin system RelE family toxin [Gammaproteobacteria bacterium]